MITTSIKPIETVYRGFRFRSRLEARWAVFFDVLGVVWQYEPEAFALPSGNYLPDFYLPEVRLWVEAKPTDEGQEAAWAKVCELAMATGVRATLVVGEPGQQVEDGGHQHWGSAGWWVAFPGAEEGLQWSDGVYKFCICPKCGAVGFEFDGRGDRVCEHGDPHGKGYSYRHERILRAVSASRAVRFEGGQLAAV